MTTRFIDCPRFLAELYTPELRGITPDLVLNVGDPSEAEAVALLEDCDIAVIDHTPLSERVLAACPRLETIVFMGTGASSFIDLDAAGRLGIRVRTISGYGDRSVAEHAVALMFAAGRRIAAMDRAIRAGEWTTLDSVEFAGKTLGVVGTGGIGREMVRLGNALGMAVIAWNRSGVPSDLPCTPCGLDDLLARADVISLHLALTGETRAIIDARRIGLIRPEAIVVNTARGGLVDEAALIEALQAGRLAHAGLDVFDDEPLGEGHPLTRLANVTLTAHAAFMTREASARLLRMALEIVREERGAGERR
jgi:D-3-phosphoglycerate dehydrogenase